MPAVLTTDMYEEFDLVCVLGPTACGKTRYAVDLARRMGAEIISADSRQVYRGMDIGTGKDLSDYGDVPYHMIDIADAGTKYNIFQYQKDALAAYKDIVSRGRRAILCGGSGLYIESFCKGYSLPEVPENQALRQKLEQFDDATLIARLASLKPLHNTTDYDTRKRLIRALEIAIYESEHPADGVRPDGVCAAADATADRDTSVSTANRNASSATGTFPRNIKYIGLEISREERNARIDRRLEARLQEGMVDEVKRLLDSGIPAEDLIYYGLEYKFVTKYLIGELTYNEMVDGLRTAIHQFAKRQMTWFRGMERRGIEIEWIPCL